MFHFTAMVTCLATLLFFLTLMNVARARAAFGIKAPATTGHPDFERLFRVQMNTLESLALFLPALWIAARYSDPRLVGGIGLVWVVARIWYAITYANDARKRGLGFAIGMFATVVLWGIAAWGVVRAMMAG